MVPANVYITGYFSGLFNNNNKFGIEKYQFSETVDSASREIVQSAFLDGVVQKQPSWVTLIPNIVQRENRDFYTFGSGIHDLLSQNYAYDQCGL